MEELFENNKSHVPTIETPLCEDTEDNDEIKVVSSIGLTFYI